MAGLEQDPSATDAALRADRAGSTMITIGWILIGFDCVSAVFLWVGLRSGSLFWVWWVIAEGVAAHAEGFGEDVEHLVTEAFPIRPLVVELQRAVIREAQLGGIGDPTPGVVIVWPGRDAGECTGRRRGPGLRLPYVSGRSVVDLVVLVEVFAVREHIGNA